jgi:hypothetical protein
MSGVIRRSPCKTDSCPGIGARYSRLERRGLIAASPNPADKRSRLITLTAEAYAVLPAIREAV